jgi:MFS family permease
MSTQASSPGDPVDRAVITRSAPDPAVASPWTFYTERRRWGLLAILFLVATSDSYDRNVISVVLEPIRQEFHVTDAMLGLLGGFCSAVFYTLFGLPLARWADRGNRRTLITLALTAWSVMTACCGLAQTFWQLALFRIGVGAGQSGATPAAQSLIADYFPPQRRASALAVFTASSMAGYLLGFLVGGLLAAAYGWRAAFFVGGAMGLALALVTRLGLSEPRNLHTLDVGQTTESLRQSLGLLLKKRSYRFVLAAAFVYFPFVFGVQLFIPAFLMRILAVPLTEMSIYYGAVTAVSTVIGTLGGGWLSDYLGRRDVRWLGWLPAVGCGLSFPLYVIQFCFHGFIPFLVVTFFWSLVLNAALPSVYAAIHAVCGSRRRAMAIAIMLFSATLFGAGVGPLMLGAISDALGSVYGANALRYALIAVAPLVLVTSGCFYLMGRAMPADVEN